MRGVSPLPQDDSQETVAREPGDSTFPTDRQPTPKSETSNRTAPRRSTSVLQLQERELFFQRQQLRHLASPALRLSLKKKRQHRSGSNCPFVHVSQYDRTPTAKHLPKPDNKYSNVIALRNAKHKETFCRFFKWIIHAKGSLKRHKASCSGQPTT